MTGLTSNDERIMTFIDEKHAEYVEKMKAAAPDSDFRVLLLFQPITQPMVKHSAESGGNVLGLEEIVAKGPTIIWLLAVTVDTAESQDKIHPSRLNTERRSTNMPAASARTRTGLISTTRWVTRMQSPVMEPKP